MPRKARIDAPGALHWIFRLIGYCFICASFNQPTCPGIAEGDDGTAGYAIRMSGAVGGPLSDGRPDICSLYSNS